MATMRKLPISFTGPDVGLLPKTRYVDPIEVAGSLLLIEPGNNLAPWAPGVPATGSVAPNLLASRAATVTGKSASLLNGSVYNVGLTGTKGKVERTSKGGLHGIISPTYDFSAAYTDAVQVRIPDELYLWIKTTGFSHNIYTSVWTSRTRQADPALVSSQALLFTSICSAGYFIAGFSATTSYPSASSGRTADNTQGPSFRNMNAVPGAAFSSDADSGTFATGNRSIFNVGNNTTINSPTARKGKAGSHVFYRAYMEDLTVSGRTYAEVDALDHAMYTKEVLTAGGRYYGDTFTNPTTIP